MENSEMNSEKTKQHNRVKELEIPTDIALKEKLMRYHDVNNDRDLKLAIYREWLKNNRNSKR
jgi:hypothetical protein